MGIEQHYSAQLDIDALLKELKQRYPDGPDCYQLAPIDQLHIGGIKASQKLITKLRQLQPTNILDIGSGMGGLMRLLQNNFPDANVTAIDITHDFNSLNQSLNKLTSSKSQIITADAQALPFADNTFDCIIFQHSLLNIPETKDCLNECRRVMTRKGALLLHEVAQGQNYGSMLFPVPWAREANQSHLLTSAQLVSELSHCGFAIQEQENWSGEALEWRKRQAAKEQSTPTKPTISPIQVLGQDFKKMGPNVMKNIANQAVEVWQILCVQD